MGHYLINTSWTCQLKCSYCLLPHIKINRAAPEHPWHEWAEALDRHAERHSLFDFAGGEPFLYDGLELLCEELHRRGHRWAITTNAMSTLGVALLLERRPGGCSQINVSDHPGNFGAGENVKRLMRAYRVVGNRVDHPDAGYHIDGISSLIPYQSWREGTELDGIKRWCSSGMHHWVADPGGDVFICNPAMATARKPLGNLFDGKSLNTPKAEFICDWGCSTCYTIVPDAWPVFHRLAE